MNLADSDKERIRELIEVCKKYQGECIPGHHGSGSWATTYSDQFIDAAAEICAILEEAGSGWPMLSALLRSEGVLSCRGSEMDIDRVEYLYHAHLKNKIQLYK